jgi:hypothetical protein
MGEEVDLFCYEDMALSPMKRESQPSPPQGKTEMASASPHMVLGASSSSTKTTSPTRTSLEPELTESPPTRRGRPKRKRIKTSKETPVVTSPNIPSKTLCEEDNNSLLHNSQYLAYTWDDLNLGMSLGSKAYNRYVNYLQGLSIDADSESSLTAVQVHQMVESLNPKLVPPPPDSNLNRYNLRKMDLTKHILPHDTNGELNKSMTINAPMEKISLAYQLMREQQADDEMATRRRIHFLTVDAVRDKIKSTENEICKLKVREENVKKRARTLGLKYFK